MSNPKPDLLPSSIPRKTTSVDGRHPFARGLIRWIKIFCANCGADGGWVPETNRPFAFYLCDPCAEKHGAPPGTVMVPDEAYWEEVRAEQMEKYGRLLTPEELAEELKHDTTLAKLARDHKE